MAGLRVKMMINRQCHWGSPFLDEPIHLCSDQKWPPLTTSTVCSKGSDNKKLRVDVKRVPQRFERIAGDDFLLQNVIFVRGARLESLKTLI